MIEPGILIIAILFTLLVSSTPIAVALGFTSLIYITLFTPLPLTQFAEKFINSLNVFPLMAIPFFVLAAKLMTEGGLGGRLVNAAKALVGGTRGGLATSTILTCVVFAAISGSSPATVVAVGALMIPAMLRNGYGKNFAVGLVTISGSLGILLPPSITFVVYGIITGQSVGALFVAGIVPGLIAAAGLIILAVIISRVRKFRGGGSARYDIQGSFARFPFGNARAWTPCGNYRRNLQRRLHPHRVCDCRGDVCRRGFAVNLSRHQIEGPAQNRTVFGEGVSDDYVYRSLWHRVFVCAHA